MWKLLSVALLTSATFGLPDAKAQPGRIDGPLQVAGWSVSSSRFPDGRLVCTANDAARTGEFWLNDRLGMALRIHNFGPVVPPSGTMPVVPAIYRIDGGPEFRDQVMVGTDGSAMLLLTGSAALLEQLKAGRTLNIRTASSSHAISLRGSSQMLDILFLCAQSSGRLSR